MPQGCVWVSFSFAAVPVSAPGTLPFCTGGLMSSQFSQASLLVCLLVFLSIMMNYFCARKFLSLKTCYCSWLPFFLRAASQGIPPNSFLNKPKPARLKSKVCTLLLSILTPFRILISMISWWLQPKLSLTVVTLGSSCSWISVPAASYPLVSPFGTCTKNLSLIPSGSLAVLPFQQLGV